MPGVHLITNSDIYVMGFFVRENLFYMPFIDLLKMLETHSIKELVLISQDQNSFLYVEDIHSIDATQNLVLLRTKDKSPYPLEISHQSPKSEETLSVPIYIPGKGFQKRQKQKDISFEDDWFYSFYVNRYPLNNSVYGAPVLINERGKIKSAGMVHSYDYNNLKIIKPEHLIRFLDNKTGSLCSNFYNAITCIEKELENLKNKAETKGDSKAQFEWAIMLYMGTGVMMNENLSFSFLKKSADQGLITATLLWSSILPEKEALITLETLISQGIMEAKFVLAIASYKSHKKMGANMRKPFLLFKELAEQDHLLSQFNLAAMYNNGEGTAKDDKQVLYWLRRAVKNGHTSVKEKIQTIEKNLRETKKKQDQPT